MPYYELITMDKLTLFGLTALASGLVCYALEARSRWWVFGFAVACAGGAVYGFLLKDAWPFGIVEAVWALVALRRWWRASPSSAK